MVQLGSRIERDGGPLDGGEIDLRLKDQVAPRDAENALERQLRMAHVVKNAETEHQIECADPVRRQLEGIDVEVFNA